MYYSVLSSNQNGISLNHKNDLHQQNIHVKEIYMENPRIYHNVHTPTLWSHIRQGYHQIILGTHSKVSAKTPHNEISAKSKHKCK